MNVERAKQKLANIKVNFIEVRQVAEKIGDKVYVNLIAACLELINLIEKDLVAIENNELLEPV